MHFLPLLMHVREDLKILCIPAAHEKPWTDRENDRVLSTDFASMAWYYSGSEVSVRAPFLLEGLGILGTGVSG